VSGSRADMAELASLPARYRRLHDRPANA